MPFLDHATTTRELPRGDTLVGSGPQAGWRLQNDGLAPRHFTVRVAADGAASLMPHAAHTVVTVNGRRAGLEATPLSHGDVIAAGSAEFGFLAHLERRSAARDARGADALAHLVDERGRVAYPLDRAVTRIGRGAENDVAVRDPAVSRHHAEVRAEAGARVLHSTGSGGTRVNGIRTETAVLEEGDVVEIGGVELRFTLGAPPEGMALRGAAPAAADEMSRRATTAVRMEDLVRARGARGQWWIVALLFAFAAFTAAAAFFLLR